MFQMKEQDKTPVELSDMETGNLLEKKFRWSQNLDEEQKHKARRQKFLTIRKYKEQPNRDEE